MQVQRVRVNDMIRISPLRVIGPDNEQLGVIEADEAKRLAREAGLDLVEVAPDTRPPVCRIMDYGRFKYEQSKREHKARQGKKTELKEVRLGRSMRIDEHDIKLRVEQARSFLLEGHKVQFIQPFRGREMQFRDKGFERMKGIESSLGDIAKVELPPRFNGRRMIMTMAPDKTKIQAVKRRQEHEQEKAQEREREEAADAAPSDEQPPAPSDETVESGDGGGGGGGGGGEGESGSDEQRSEAHAEN